MMEIEMTISLTLKINCQGEDMALALANRSALYARYICCCYRSFAQLHMVASNSK